MERKAFTIVRATWWRGRTAIESKLLRANDGMMCCLGTIALQAGATADQIRGITSPSMLRRKKVVLDAFVPLVLPQDASGWNQNSVIAEQLMAINDNDDITDAQRETELTRLAATIGWDLTFVD